MQHESFAELALQAQNTALSQELARCNELSETYGLRLSGGQIQALLAAREQSLRDTGRMEPGSGVLPRLIYAFCDSPYMDRHTYAQTLSTLQDLFYALKSEVENAMTDDELIEALARIFNGRAQGSLEYLDNLTVGELYRAMSHRSGYDEEDGVDASEWAEDDADE